MSEEATNMEVDGSQGSESRGGGKKIEVAGPSGEHIVMGIGKMEKANRMKQTGKMEVATQIQHNIDDANKMKYTSKIEEASKMKGINKISETSKILKANKMKEISQIKEANKMRGASSMGEGSQMHTSSNIREARKMKETIKMATANKMEKNIKKGESLLKTQTSIESATSKGNKQFDPCKIETPTREFTNAEKLRKILQGIRDERQALNKQRDLSLMSHRMEQIKRIREERKLEEDRKIEVARKTEEDNKLRDAWKIEEANKIREARKIEETKKLRDAAKIRAANKMREAMKIEETNRLRDERMLEEVKKLRDEWKIKEANKIREAKKKEEANKLREARKMEEANKKREARMIEEASKFEKAIRLKEAIKKGESLLRAGSSMKISRNVAVRGNKHFTPQRMKETGTICLLPPKASNMKNAIELEKSMKMEEAIKKCESLIKAGSSTTIGRSVAIRGNKNFTPNRMKEAGNVCLLPPKERNVENAIELEKAIKMEEAIKEGESLLRAGCSTTISRSVAIRGNKHFTSNRMKEAGNICLLPPKERNVENAIELEKAIKMEEAIKEGESLLRARSSTKVSRNVAIRGNKNFTPNRMKEASNICFLPPKESNVENAIQLDKAIKMEEAIKEGESLLKAGNSVRVSRNVARRGKSFTPYRMTEAGPIGQGNQMNAPIKIEENIMEGGSLLRASRSRVKVGRNVARRGKNFTPYKMTEAGRMGQGIQMNDSSNFNAPIKIEGAIKEGESLLRPSRSRVRVSRNVARRGKHFIPHSQMKDTSNMENANNINIAIKMENDSNIDEASQLEDAVKMEETIMEEERIILAESSKTAFVKHSRRVAMRGNKQFGPNRMEEVKQRASQTGVSTKMKKFIKKVRGNMPPPNPVGRRVIRRVRRRRKITLDDIKFPDIDTLARMRFNLAEVSMESLGNMFYDIQGKKCNHLAELFSPKPEKAITNNMDLVRDARMQSAFDAFKTTLTPIERHNFYQQSLVRDHSKPKLEPDMALVRRKDVVIPPDDGTMTCARVMPVDLVDYAIIPDDDEHINKFMERDGLHMIRVTMTDHMGDTFIERCMNQNIHETLRYPFKFAILEPREKAKFDKLSVQSQYVITSVIDEIEMLTEQFDEPVIDPTLDPAAAYRLKSQHTERQIKKCEAELEILRGAIKQLKEVESYNEHKESVEEGINNAQKFLVEFGFMDDEMKPRTRKKI